jgi:hypothetical protein
MQDCSEDEAQSRNRGISAPQRNSLKKCQLRIWGRKIGREAAKECSPRRKPVA